MAFVAATAATALNGCSLIGLGVGHRVDLQHVSYSIDAARGFAPGTSVRVHLRDREVVRGRLDAVEWRTREEYETAYESWRRERGGPWASPAFGQRIQLVLTDRSERDVRFAGVAFDSLMGWDETAGSVCVAPLNRVFAYRDSAGAEHPLDRLPWTDARSDLPRDEVIRVITPAGTQTLRGEEVAFVRSGGASRHMVAGLALGVVLDLFAALLAAQLLLPDN